MEDDLLLKGFGFSGYRSFGNELVKIAPLKKINLIIGQNNAGKSNIIKFLHEQYCDIPIFDGIEYSPSKEGNSSFSDLDLHILDETISYKIAFPLLKNDIDEHLNEIWQNRNIVGYGDQCKNLAKKVLESVVDDNNECFWFSYKHQLIPSTQSNPSTKSKFFIFDFDQEINNLQTILNEKQWNMLWETLTKKSTTHIKQKTSDCIVDVMRLLSLYNANKRSIKVNVIPAIRNIGETGSKIKVFGDEGIIETLAQMQNPAPENYKSDKQKFLDINKFVQNVLEDQNAKIEIPHKRDMILVHMDRKILPLESLGTGVHEVIILAAASTILGNTIMCIEEPEVHLHPLLQKKLVRYLSKNTNNQYFFTTHSAHLLDAVEASIFHVTLENGVSKVEYISSTEQKSNICNDLGYKASDLLQANCIIWVEGPSDRIYLNYWLENYCRQNKMRILIEGIDYSIMFYGGRLFSHLTALDEDEKTEKIEDFISLKSLNRNAVIMFDSDKDKEEAELNSTKQRLKDEFDKGSGFAWVTEGREVENYLEADKVEEAVLHVHPKIANKLISKDQWSNILKFKHKNNHQEEMADKVKVAKYYIKPKEKEKEKENSEPNFDILDLKERLKQLITFILKSNSIE